MLIDARSLADGSVLDTDLAIIGAGAAGIAMAREFAGSGIRVALIESGGLEPDPDTQTLYQGETTALNYPLEGSRLRYFGGSTNHWGGWCRPLEPLDFEERDWVPHSGWPVDRATLDPYYDRARAVCEIPTGAFDDTAAWAEHGTPLPLAGDEVLTRFFLYSPPTRFGSRYRPDIERAANIACWLHANVLEIVPAAGGARVEHLRIATLTGLRHTVRPRVCVLAAGGIENARILLASDSVEPAGLGNRHDRVGRFFMEHPHVPSPAVFLITDPELVAPFYRAHTRTARGTVRGCLMLSEAYLRRTRRLGTVMTFAPAHAVTPGEREEGAGASLAAILQLAHSTTGDPAPGEELGWRFGVGCASEQIPDPESRITLSGERDALGMPRTRLAWRLRHQDAESLRENLKAVARAFGGWGEGRVRILFPEREHWDPAEGWGNHHMGTTRMATDPAKGVTDADCRVHGLANLYIAGSSLFPTGGAVNPTLTLLALALRLSDHLKAGFRQGAFNR